MIIFLARLLLVRRPLLGCLLLACAVPLALAVGCWLGDRRRDRE